MDSRLMEYLWNPKVAHATGFTLQGESALLDLVTLCRSEALVYTRPELFAGLGVQALVAGADGPRVSHAAGRERLACGLLAAAAQEEHGHFYAGPTDFHVWFPRVRYEVIRECLALVQRTRARAVANHWLPVDVDLLVDIEPLLDVFQAQRRCAAGERQHSCHFTGPHEFTTSLKKDDWILAGRENAAA